jgi:uncharacterized protein (TIGR02186 family)
MTAPSFFRPPLAKLAAVLALAASLGFAAAAAAVEPLVADLSNHLVAITTGFAGTDVLLFGAVEDMAETMGSDVVVVVRGPNHSEVVRRKGRAGGLWVNSGRAEVVNAPSFYWVASTRPLPDLAPSTVLDREQIGLDHLPLDIRVADPREDAGAYREALMRLRQRNGLYGAGAESIGFLSHRLFRTDIHFPANVPVGIYTVEVYLFAGKEVVSAQTTPLVISKIGVGADMFDFAHHYAAAYGIIAILLAASAGWLAAAAFRRS